MKFFEDKDKREGLERVIGLLLVVGIGFGIFLFFNNKAHKNDVDTVTKSTECYSISVPATYKTRVISKNCQFVAYSGADTVKKATNVILIIPYSEKLNDQKAAAAQLHSESPQTKTYKKSKIKIDGAEAVFIEGETTVANQKKYNRFYAVYGLRDYKPSGKDFTANSFRIGFTVQDNDREVIEPILKSIRWK